MREALRGLTLRGRSFLAAGVTAVVCAVLLGQPTLGRVGVLLVALPLVTAFVVGRGRHQLALARSVVPAAVAAGQPARVHLTLTNEGRMPTGALRAEEHLPYALGARPRFVLHRMHQGWQRSVDYPVRAEVRGRYEIGPMTVRATDPFGMVELTRAFRTTATLLVTPRPVTLPAIPLGGALSGSGDHRPRAFAGGTAEDVTVRDYRRGDDLRRVHWRSSARVGELMVRREEQPWQARATVFLDNRAGAHLGRGAASSLETAVLVAASVATHLAGRGFTVQLATATGEDPVVAQQARDGQVSSQALLEALALVEPVTVPSYDLRWLNEQSGGVVVAVLGAVTSSDLGGLRRLQHHADSSLALCLDVAAWGPGRIGRSHPTAAPLRPDTASADLLARHGWRSTTLQPDSRLDQAWQGLASRGPGGPAVQAGREGQEPVVTAQPASGATS